MTERLMSEMVRHRPAVTVGPSVTAAEAARRMLEQRIGAVLVTDAEGGLHGIFTGRDAIRMLADGKSGDVPVQNVMTREVCTLGPGCTAIEALRLMEDGGFRHVPVVDGDRVAGIVSWGDFRTHEHDRLNTEVGYWERI